MAMVQGSKLADIGTGGTCPRVRDGGLRRRGRGWGIRVLKGSTAKKDLDFRRMCRLINAFGGNTAKKNLKIFTFKAGMCMKTNKTMTKCPKKVGRFCLSFGHFRLTNTNFAEIRGESTVAYNNPHGQTA